MNPTVSVVGVRPISPLPRQPAHLRPVALARRPPDPALRHASLPAPRAYAARRVDAADALGVRPLPPGAATAGGMPDRVKCLHALAAHELAVPAANPFGREAILAMGQWWAAGPCVDVPAAGEREAHVPDC